MEPLREGGGVIKVSAVGVAQGGPIAVMVATKKFQHSDYEHPQGPEPTAIAHQATRS